MNIFKKQLKLFVLIGLVFISGCETTDFDLQRNPNRLTEESASADAIINEIQFLFRRVIGELILSSDDVMRYEAMSRNYARIAGPTLLTSEWTNYYRALNLSRTLENLTNSNDNLTLHSAVNKLLIGYLSIAMVDYLGDIPFSQATNHEAFPNPELDSGAQIYKNVLADIDDAITALNTSNGANLSTDIFYNNNRNKWIAFANSFKLKILIQARLAGNQIGIADIAAEINTLLNANLIDSANEDFIYPYDSVITPESRHPYYIRAYRSGGFDEYICNWFMNQLFRGKGMPDPRIRYYIYRQSDDNPLPSSNPGQLLACGSDPQGVDPNPDPSSNGRICYVGQQYWGIDHGEDRTGRGDDLQKTVYGMYPGGGAFDANQFVRADRATPSLDGAGILPLLTSFHIDFFKAEAALTLNTAGNPAALLESGIRKNMTKVLGFGNVNNTMEPTQANVDAYVTTVMNRYNAATNNDDRLNIIITEAYLATYGNSIEAYNAYRRTGFPRNIQATVSGDRQFPRLFSYPNADVQRNSSLSQRMITEQVFWDTNAAGFIE